MSREQADAGRFPAIDIAASRSRLQNNLINDDHRRASEHIRRLIAKYKDIELLLQIGDYVSGSDPLADEAIWKIETIRQFFQQTEHESIDPDDAVRVLIDLADEQPN